MLKRLDKLLISSFIPPFIVAFFIAVFVLMMQFVWVYIDEIIGKGVELFTLIELLGYLSVSRIPMALPLGVLIASVMVMGNLAEKYELSSFKSAGISLLRVMRPLMVMMLLISAFSFYCSNNLIPIANLKFGSRLYDIRRQKPALSIQEGVFNDDFQDFVIRIKNKLSDNQSIEDVLIYNQTGNFEKINQISAKGGKMFTTADKQYLVMQLSDGVQYQEVENANTDKSNHPFVRTEFKSLQKVYDLKEFELNRTDEELFKSHQMMLTSSELSHKVDSINVKITERENSLPELFPRYFSSLKQVKTNKTPETENVGNKPKLQQIAITYPPPPEQNKELSKVKTFLDLYSDSDRKSFSSRSLTSVRSMQSELQSLNESIDRSRKARNLHQYEMHIKFSIAAICFVFLFVGAPMGAIVRKGGFGYPLLISIVYFMIFIVLNILCKNLTDELVLDGVTAAWMPVLVLAPIGLILTNKAIKDSSIFQTDRIKSVFEKLVKYFKKSREKSKT